MCDEQPTDMLAENLGYAYTIIDSIIKMKRSDSNFYCDEEEVLLEYCRAYLDNCFNIIS